MSEIDIVIPQDTNPIEITTPTATEETEVQAEETQNNTSYNVGGDAYYTDLAKDWAIKMNGKVLGQDYSSKYYAYLAQQIEGQVAQNTEDAQIWAEGTDAQVQALGGEHSSKGWVNYVLTNPPEAYVTQTQTGCLLTVTDINGTTTAELLNGQDGAPGADGTDGTDGADGVGISSINKTSTSGLVDTYTITLSDSNTYNFTVTNGQNGDKGDKGDKGDTGNTGATGPTGNGIANIAKTSTSGLVDTYTITYTNADTDNFTVTNGQNGTNGTNGTDGQDGADGFSPIATVTKSGDTATISITDKNGTTTATISDGQDQPELTFSTGLTDTNHIITVTDYAKLIKNTATGSNAVTIASSSATSANRAINIGTRSSINANAEDSTAIGYLAVIGGNSNHSIAIGSQTGVNANSAIQLGYGENTTANSINIGFYNTPTTHYNWQLLDGITGLIPDARLSTNIARTVDIPTVPTNISAFTNDSGYITGIDSTDVITALGYTPYSSSNPDGYITSSALSSYVDLSSAQNITGTKTFVGQKKIAFKQSSSSDKLGFTLYNNSGTEKGYLEFNPSNTVDSVPLMTLGNYASAAAGLTHVGFRKYSSISGASGAYNLLAPLISDARTPFNLTTTYTNFYLPLGFTDGNTTVLTAKTGLVDISSLLPTIPTVNNSTITFTQGGVNKGTITLNQSNNDTIALDAGGGGGASALTDLSDVSITSASNGEALVYDNGDWINAPKTLVIIKDWTVS